jgi:hypothetical protein
MKKIVIGTLLFIPAVIVAAILTVAECASNLRMRKVRRL